MSVKIINENDNAPEFSQALYVGHVTESLAENSPVISEDGKSLVIHATDADVGNSDLMYEVVGCSAFNIDPHNGALVTAKVQTSELLFFFFSYEVFISRSNWNLKCWFL